MHILKLPTKILDEITSNLRIQDWANIYRDKDLKSLSLVCSTLRGVAICQIFKELCFTDLDFDSKSSEDSKIRYASDFVQMLRQSSLVASSVRRLEIHSLWQSPNYTLTLLSILDLLPNLRDLSIPDPSCKPSPHPLSRKPIDLDTLTIHYSSNQPLDHILNGLTLFGRIGKLKMFQLTVDTSKTTNTTPLCLSSLSIGSLVTAETNDKTCETIYALLEALHCSGVSHTIKTLGIDLSEKEEEIEGLGIVLSSFVPGLEMLDVKIEYNYEGRKWPKNVENMIKTSPPLPNLHTIKFCWSDESTDGLEDLDISLIPLKVFGAVLHPPSQSDSTLVSGLKRLEIVLDDAYSYEGLTKLDTALLAMPTFNELFLHTECGDGFSEEMKDEFTSSLQGLHNKGLLCIGK